MNNNVIMKTATLMISSSIPDEIIIYEILKRLPVKTLCRFKAVSKRWLSIINSRPFIDSHFHHSKLNPTPLFAFYNINEQHPPIGIFFSKNCPQKSSYNWPGMKYLWCSTSISPRGLMCFNGNDLFHIWNPSTGEHKEVNPPPCKLTTRCPLFLGFDPVSKKHKLLLSSINDGNYVFTLGENKWRKMDSSINLIPTRKSCCIDGIVYYLARRYQNDDLRYQNDYELVLAQFDIRSESFLEPIRLPGELVEFPHINCSIYVYRDRILLLKYDHMNTYEYHIWVLEKHKWSPKRLIPRLPPAAELYTVDINGEELLIYSFQLNANSEANFQLCSYDLEKGSSWTETAFPELKKVLDGSATYVVSFYNYVNTLESLKPLSIEQEQDKS